MTTSNIRYYFDNQMKKCLSFEYGILKFYLYKYLKIIPDKCTLGGCRGNENNFDDIGKCERICSIMNEPGMFKTQYS